MGFSAPESEEEKKSPPPLIETNKETAKEAASGDENESAGENVAKPDVPQTDATEIPKSGSDQGARFKEPKYKPLDEVRDYIRQRVAAEKANAIIDAKFAAIRKRMNSFAAARQYADEDGIAIIKRPNFSELADKQGLRADSVQLRSAWYFQRDTDIGRSFQRQPRSQFNPYGSQQPYVDIVFGQMGEQSWWNAVETIDDENFGIFPGRLTRQSPRLPSLRVPFGKRSCELGRKAAAVRRQKIRRGFWRANAEKNWPRHSMAGPRLPKWQLNRPGADSLPRRPFRGSQVEVRPSPIHFLSRGSA